MRFLKMSEGRKIKGIETIKILNYMEFRRKWNSAFQTDFINWLKMRLIQLQYVEWVESLYSLENGSSKISENTQLILSPQSEIREFRKYLSESGYETVKEYMISEDGQFYVIIDCRRNGYKNELICTGDTEKEVYYRYGEELLKGKNKSLREYLLRELRISQGVRNKLENINNDKIAGRLKELDFDLECIKYALEFYK